MSKSIGLENIEDLAVPEDIATQFMQLDAQEFANKREELYTEMCFSMGSLLIGPAQFYEVSAPFIADSTQLRVLSEPTAKPQLRRISVNSHEGIIYAPDNEDQGVGPSPLPKAETVLLRDHLLDVTHRRLRAGQSIMDRTFEGRWRMDNKKPTFFERGNVFSLADENEDIVTVRRGTKFEADFYSIPLLTGKWEVKVLSDLLKLRDYLTPTFQEEVTLEFEHVRNNVTY